MEIKILFTGSVGAGKSSAIGTISEIPVISTEAKATDKVAQQKATTTVAFDYGEFSLEDGQKIKLFGTPGQIRFSYMWDILRKNALGLIILVDNSAESPLEELQQYLEYFQDFIQETAVVIGVTHSETGVGPAIDDYYQFLAQRDMCVPLFPVDARDADNVKVLIEALVAMIQAG